jgi:CDGSH-type Zn-finger protein
VTIAPEANGPLIIEGRVLLVGPEGPAEVVESPVLCRCGHSAAKPYCDDSHLRCGFQAAGVAVGWPERR